jgi:hypothetical protein
MARAKQLVRHSPLMAVRASVLFRIALLCFAVFCQHTAHAARTASQPLRLTSCQAKVAAEPPSSERKVTLRVRRGVFPPRILTNLRGTRVAARNTGATCPADSASLLQRFEACERQNLSIERQFRPFALRI